MDNIYEAYRQARANKRRSADSVEYEMHLEKNLTELVDAVNDRTLQPTAYTFISTKPKPREVFATDMATRIVHHYLKIRLLSLIEDELTERTFNNRIGYGVDRAVNQLISDIYEVTEGHAREAWVITADLSGYFPNASQDRAYEQLRSIIERRYFGDDKEDVLWLAMRCVFSYAQDHCYRKSPLEQWALIPKGKSTFDKPCGISAYLGYLIWQIEMNYYLNDFDHYNIDFCGFHYLRFVDDMAWVTVNKECMLAMFPQFRKLLAEAGCKFNEHKFTCQPVCRGVKYIGKVIKGRRVYASQRNVRNFYRAARGFRRCARESKLDTFLSSINSYTGTLKNVNGYNIIRNGVNIIGDSWSKFVHFDESRLCYVPNDEYAFRKRISRRYNVKFKKLK